jgi:peptidylprolyl isomerase
LRRHSIVLGLVALILVATVVALVACEDDDETPAENGGDMTQGPPQVSGETVTTDSGLQYIVIEEGTGASPTLGQTVVVHYTGWLESDGTKFDSSVDRGAPSAFMLGQVIEGWNEGLSVMKVGGKHRLIIPPELGYGQQGFPPKIPANATLIFDVELLEIQ